MKICYISNLYVPHDRGGAERVVRTLAHETASLGHKVEVITSAPWQDVQFGSMLREEDGLIVHRLFHWNFYFNRDSGAYPFWARLLNLIWSCFNVVFAYNVWKVLRDMKPDAVHTHNLAGTSFLIPLVIRLLKIRHVHTLHDIQLVVASGRMTVGEEYDWIHSGFLARIFAGYQKIVWGTPAVVTAPSEWLLSYYKTKKFFKHSRFELVRHYFGVPATFPTEFPRAHVSREKFTYLYVGQIERAKGVLMLIRQFADLRARGEISDQAELIIVGSGEDEAVAKIMASVCAEISCVGQLDSSRVAHMMRSSDVVVVPSMLYENSPNVVVEALGLGRPVAVSDVGGAAELVRACDGGWVVEPNETAWRHQLLWLFKNQQTVVQKVPLLQLSSATTTFEKLYV